MEVLLPLQTFLEVLGPPFTWEWRVQYREPSTCIFMQFVDKHLSVYPSHGSSPLMLNSSPSSPTMSQKSQSTPTQTPIQTTKNSVVRALLPPSQDNITRLALTTNIICQGLIMGTSLGGGTVLVLFLLLVIYFKRRQRLRQHPLHTRISIDSDATEVQEMSQTQAQGTLTPFTLPLPLNILSQL
jgi:hypothetical protein